jgi:hypothetical protein
MAAVSAGDAAVRGAVPEGDLAAAAAAAATALVSSLTE